MVDKAHADGGAELGVVQATIWGIVLPATARLPQGGLPASLNTAVNALRHVGARGCRRDVQGQEVGAPSSLGAFRGLSGGCGWDTALSTWLAVQGLGGSELIGGDSAPWDIPRSWLLLRNIIQNSVEMRSRRMHMYTVRQLCLLRGARRVLLCVVRWSCVGKVPLLQFWASAVCSCASPDSCGRPATAGTFGHGSCHGGASVGCSETPPRASCGPTQIHGKRFPQCPQKLEVPLTKNRSKNEIRPVPHTARHAPLSSTSPSHRSKCTQFGTGQPIQILSSGLRGTLRR